ncbi:MAG TPA: hypothetical protein VJB08_02095 [Candidatus Nanoarchaeia archaeon]|nr:hypothetical protein [Candidatus Nanoarchaeia archaeon]
MKSLLMLIFVFTLVISPVSAQASATQCNDGIDNDNDGKIDVLTTGNHVAVSRWVAGSNCGTVCGSVAGFHSARDAQGNSCTSGESVISNARNSLGAAIYLYGCWPGGCASSGQARDAQRTTSYGSYCYREGQRSDDDITDITVACHCVSNDFFVCNDGIDNDQDGSTDTQDSGCNGEEDNSELQHDDGCSSTSDNDETGQNDCEGNHFAWQGSISQNPCCGDDESDYSFSLGNKLCIKNPQGAWQWITGTTGQVVTGEQDSIDNDLTTQHDFMYDGTQWKQCMNVPDADAQQPPDRTESVTWTATIGEGNNQWFEAEKLDIRGDGVSNPFTYIDGPRTHAYGYTEDLRTIQSPIYKDDVTDLISQTQILHRLFSTSSVVSNSPYCTDNAICTGRGPLAAACLSHRPPIPSAYCINAIDAISFVYSAAPKTITFTATAQSPTSPRHPAFNVYLGAGPSQCGKSCADAATCTQQCSIDIPRGWSQMRFSATSYKVGPTARNVQLSLSAPISSLVDALHFSTECTIAALTKTGSFSIPFASGEYTKDVTDQFTFNDCLNSVGKSSLSITDMNENVIIYPEDDKIMACLDTDHDGNCDTAPGSAASNTQPVDINQRATANTHEYFCSQSGAEQNANYAFSECCGDETEDETESCLSERATNIYHTADPETFSDTPYVCLNDKTWNSNIDFDANQQNCERGGYQWAPASGSAPGFCCGDGDPEDNGKRSADNKYLCVHANTGNAWFLNDATTSRHLGTIRRPAGKDYLSDGTSWKKCENSRFDGDGNPTVVQITNPSRSDQDICIGNEVYECVGSQTVNGFINLANRAKHTGNIVLDGLNPSNQIRYYCASGNFFTTNLDTPPPTSDPRTTVPPNSNFEATCRAAQLTWTGRYCCSEAEDSQVAEDAKETYNDEGGTGICAYSQFKPNGPLADTPRILVVNGVAQGCQATSQELALQNHPDPANDDSLGPLITANPLCTIKTITSGATENKYYCSPTGWQVTETSLNRRYAPGATPTDTLQQDCCPANKCYNPTGGANAAPACVDPGETAIQGGSQYICEAGTWQQTSAKLNWDNEAGYCREPTQCLVNPNPSESAAATLAGLETLGIDDASNNDIHCIDSGQYIGDHYCESGKWTTRTKLLALTLRDSPDINGEDKYTIYCDTYDKVANSYGYSLPEALPQFDVNQIFAPSDPKQRLANNVCVLVLDDGTAAFGTSLNQPFNEPQQRGNAQVNIWDLVDAEQNDCNVRIPGDNSMQFCIGNQLWYNPYLQLMVYSKEGITLNTPNFAQQTTAFLSNPIRAIMNLINRFRDTNPTLAVNEFLSQTKNFDTLYLAKNGEREVKAFIEEGLGDNHDKDHFSALFSCFNEDICTSIESEYPPSTNNDVRCSVQGTDSAVQFQRTRQTSAEVWTSLISSLRLNADTKNACD